MKNVKLSPAKLVIGAALIGVLGFNAGTRSDEIEAFIAPLFGQSADSNRLDASSLENTYKTLKKYYNGELGSNQELLDGANHGLVDAVGDDYTQYFTAKEAAEFEDSLNGDIGGGIGAEVGKRNDQPTILRVLDDNPAAEAGLHAGDTILRINDKSVIGESVETVVDQIRGEIGTSVKLVVKRDGKNKTFSITRAEVVNPSVSAEIKDGIGILTLSRFDDQTAELAAKEAIKFKNQNVNGIVLDLRGNGGGVLGASQGVAGLWLKDKVVVKVDGRGGDSTLRSTGKQLFSGIPTAVLVNGSTASAAEIVSGALQDYDAATIVGETTFGKGTVQELVPLQGGALLKVTVQRWYTPNGKNITKQGIKPDKTVGLTQENLDAGKDLQLKAALKQLK